MKMFFQVLLSLLALIVLFIAWASYPWSLKGKTQIVEVEHVEPEGMVDSVDAPSVVKILTWNLGFLYGEGSEGPGYSFHEKEYFEKRLDQVVKEIKSWNPDIICFQEIDFDSSRSHGINQARYIAAKAGYPYLAEAVSWDAHYIPFPYWPIRNHFGQVKSGGAILSKYPLLDHEVTLLEKPQSQPWWYNLFYLHRYFQRVTVELGEKKFKLINLHLEAFDKVDRLRQAKLLVKKAEEENIHWVAGDFNMLPDSALKKGKFPNGDDYENDKSFGVLLSSHLLEVIPEEIYSQNEAQFFTFPSSRPDRRLDYIFYQEGLKMMRAEVLPSALSDHLPLRATFQIDYPKFNLYSL